MLAHRSYIVWYDYIDSVGFISAGLRLDCRDEEEAECVMEIMRRDSHYFHIHSTEMTTGF